MLHNTAVRVAIVVAVALVVHGVYFGFRMYGTPTDFRDLREDLTKMPLRLGPWEGTKIEIDEKISGAVGADVVVNRSYANPAGYTVSLHANSVKHYDFQLQHHPRHCYTTHGARLIKEYNDARLDMPDGSSVPVGLMHMENNGQPILVLYWYQLGDRIVLNHVQQREVRYTLRGQDTWPQLIKVLLQAPAMNLEVAEEQLMDFASFVYPWTKDLDRQDEAAAVVE